MKAFVSKKKKAHTKQFDELKRYDCTIYKREYKNARVLLTEES